MSKSVRAKAFILRAIKYRESDLILSALTSDGTKISFLARGALNSKKRFAGGVLEPTHFVELQYREPLNESKLATLEEAQLLDGFEGLRKNYDKLEVALFVIETLSQVSQEGDSLSDGLFNLAGHSLRALEKASDIKNFKLHFCLKILLQQGTLEPKAWMSPYLKTSMADHTKLEQNKELEPQLIWIESKLREYLATGMLSS